MRRGPNRAIFSEELNTDVVFDIESSAGGRIRGGIRAIQATDFKSGRTVVLGTVKPSVKAQLLPPNKILYASAFEGIEADLIFVWKHNLFSHDVVIRERPQLPPEWNAANVRLEVVTEFFPEAEPKLRGSVHRAENQPELQDNAVIHFGAMAMIMGKAFRISEEQAGQIGELAEGGAPVVKEWLRTADNRTFLVESVAWAEADRELQELPIREARGLAPVKRETALAAMAMPAAARSGEPIQLASAEYRPTGYLLDFVIVPDQGSPVGFLAGETYYIKSSYMNGTMVGFSPGSVIKFKNNTYMLFYGTLSFPATNQMMVTFTSRNDDRFGARIQGVSGETDSDGNPANHKAAQAIWLYYETYNVTIQQARFAWAKVGIQRDRNSMDTATLAINDCVFTDITGTGSAAYSGSTTYLTSTRLKKCNVDTAGLTMTTDCEPYVVANFAGLKQSDVDFHIPDTQAAVGDTLVMELIHSRSNKSAVAFFNKYTGVKQTIHGVMMEEFFSVSGTNIVEPFDPRLIYDQQSQRWIATCLQYRGNSPSRTNMVIAISKGADPMGNGGTNWVSDRWVKHLIPLPGSHADFDTLGVDANGIYVSAQNVNNYNVYLATIPKAALLTNTGSTTISSAHITTFPSVPGTPFPIVNYDGVAADPHWFIYGSSTGIHYANITWSGGVATVTTNWSFLSHPGSIYYITNTSNINAPQHGSEWGDRIDVHTVGSRLTTPVSRKLGTDRSIWTSRVVGVSSSGTPGTDFSAIEIIQLSVGTSSLSFSSSVIKRDETTNGVWYYCPSLAVNKFGDIFVGASGSSSNTYVGAYNIAKLASGNWPSSFRPFYSGKQDFLVDGGVARWGDYSATFIDPNGVTVWTIQKYAEFQYSSVPLNAFGTRIAAFAP